MVSRPHSRGQAGREQVQFKLAQQREPENIQRPDEEMDGDDGADEQDRSGD